MNCNNVQSPNFGMAYRIHDKKGFIKSANQLSTEATIKLNEQMKSAIENLGLIEKSKTKFADVNSFVSNDKIYHGVNLKIPYITENGQVAYKSGSGQTFETLKLDEAVKNALAEENRLASVDASKKQMAELMNASTK